LAASACGSVIRHVVESSSLVVLSDRAGPDRRSSSGAESGLGSGAESGLGSGRGSGRGSSLTAVRSWLTEALAASYA